MSLSTLPRKAHIFRTQRWTEIHSGPGCEGSVTTECSALKGHLHHTSCHQGSGSLAEEGRRVSGPGAMADRKKTVSPGHCGAATHTHSQRCGSMRGTCVSANQDKCWRREESWIQSPIPSQEVVDIWYLLGGIKFVFFKSVSPISHPCSSGRSHIQQCRVSTNWTSHTQTKHTHTHTQCWLVGKDCASGRS